MPTLTRIPGRTGPFAARAGAAVLTALLLLGAGPAAAADPAPSATPSAAGRQTAAADQQTRADRLADELRKNPVYVSAARPRELPRSLAPQIADLARRTGVPTYVLAVPDSRDGAQLLALVHDRLGKDGLYVLIGEYGRLTTAAFGTDAPAQEAARVALYGTPYGAGPLADFEAFVDAVALGKEQAAAKAEQLADRYRKSDGRPSLYISSTDRQNQNLLLGIAVVLLPGLLIALGLRLSRRRGAPHTPAGQDRGKGGVDLGKATAEPKKPKNPNRPAQSKKPAAVRPPLRRGVPAATALAAVAAVLGVLLAAPEVFPQTVDSPDLNVTQADLDARVDEVAAGLAAGPVYQDPSAPDALNAADLPALRQRIAELAPAGPVHVVVTPSTSADETGHDGRLLLSLIRERTGQNGVYILVDPLVGRIELRSYGTDRDAERRFAHLDSEIRYPYGATDGLDVKPRLDRVLDAVAEAQPRPGDDPVPTGLTLPPLRDNKLPPLFAADFGGGLVLGGMLLGVVLLLAWAAVAAVRAVIRSRRARALAPAQPAGPRRADPRPTLRQLRSWAAEDVRELTAGLAAADQDAPGRARAWDCLDAAHLLTGNGRTEDEAGDLAAVAVLARGGLAALRGETTPTVCRLNPLHGAATGGRVPPWFAALGIGPRSTRLCPACRDAFRGADSATAAAGRRPAAEERLLRLPPAGDRAAPTAWDRAGPILPAAREGLEPLILRARESASVQ
ncbi:hypothetical protein ACFV1L_07610 [Kitasatospora sp. NPDC059646]|uniref:hypothetical protein n=1 Tax=Kitasatospora sp. NPDC059646 TaxID=3346893 RepID=UPI0036CCBF73